MKLPLFFEAAKEILKKMNLIHITYIFFVILIQRFVSLQQEVCLKKTELAITKI